MNELRPEHILAVNDDRELLCLYTEMLTDEGYRVSVATIPTTDLADVHAVAPDLVVLDLIVGGRDRGTAFIELLRSDPTTRALPVLVCSADTERLADIAGRLAAWGCLVVEKPFDVDVFLEAVRAALSDTVPAGPTT